MLLLNMDQLTYSPKPRFLHTNIHTCICTCTSESVRNSPDRATRMGFSRLRHSSGIPQTVLPHSPGILHTEALTWDSPY